MDSKKYTMIENKVFRWLLLVVLIATSTKINAQDTMNTGQRLSVQQQSIIGIAALTGKGNLEKLKTELNTGLDAGLTVNQIKETLMHVYAYRSEEHTSELQSRENLVCRLLL